MTTQTEALKLAVEEIKRVKAICLREAGIGLCNEVVIAKLEEALAQPEQETQAYREAAQLAKWLFKTHYAQEEHYASGRVVWGLCDTTAGVISQIDNMVCKLVLPKEPEQEPVTVLPDGSAFAVMSYPLPKDHWLYAERQYECGADEPNELGKPILTHAVCDAVVSAVRYAIRGATNCGKKLDFDPDALVQNAVYALCGPYGSPKPKEPEKEPMFTYEQVKAHIQAAMMSTTPPQRTWVGLTDDEMFKTWLTVPAETEDRLAFGRAVEAKLKAKNERKEKNTRNGGCL